MKSVWLTTSTLRKFEAAQIVKPWGAMTCGFIQMVFWAEREPSRRNCWPSMYLRKLASMLSTTDSSKSIVWRRMLYRGKMSYDTLVGHGAKAITILSGLFTLLLSSPGYRFDKASSLFYSELILCISSIVISASRP